MKKLSTFQFLVAVVICLVINDYMPEHMLTHKAIPVFWALLFFRQIFGEPNE